MNALKWHCKLILCAALVFAAGVLVSPYAAAASSKGKNFFLTFIRNQVPSLSAKTLFISSETPASGTVDIAGVGFHQEFTVQPSQVVKIELPRKGISDYSTESISNMGIKVTSDADITVYGLDQFSQTTDAYMALPVDALGTEYRIMSYTPLAASEIAIVGVYDNTEVTITLPKSFGYAKKTFTLNSNQTASYLHYKDLTGTQISASAPVAVVSGNNCAYVPSDSRYCDHMVEMLPPVSSWGKEFVTVPLASRAKGDLFRIVASHDNTDVTINGNAVANLGAGDFYETILTEKSVIVASQPVLVAQFAMSQLYDGAVGDPFMMLVPPSEQFLNHYTFIALDDSVGFADNFVNVVARTGDEYSIQLDGSPVDPTVFQPIGNSGFSAAQIPVTGEAHTISGTDPFGIYSYGFRQYESYGYPGGMNFDLINPNGDKFPPNLKLMTLDASIEGVAGDSEDLDLNDFLDLGEDLNGNGVIDRRSEDANRNNVLDDGEDTNGDGLLDRDSGIYRIELSGDSENLELNVQGFIPGALKVAFSIHAVNPALPSHGTLIVKDGVGNTVGQKVGFIDETLLQNVRVVSTLSTNNIDLDDTTFSQAPYSVDVQADRTLIEWRFDSISIGQIENLDYDVVMKDPVPGETRTITHSLDLYYNDVNGNPVSLSLGSRSVAVPLSSLSLATATDKIQYKPGETVVITSQLANLDQAPADVSVDVSVIDQQGALVSALGSFEESLNGGESRQLAGYDFGVGNLQAGQYRVLAELKDSIGAVILTSEAPFSVVTASGEATSLAASVNTDKAIYQGWDSVAIQARLQNTATNDLIGSTVSELVVTDPSGNELLHDTRSLSSLTASAIQDFNFYLTLSDAAAGQYQVQWVTRDADSGESIASSQKNFIVEHELTQAIVGSVTVDQSRIYHNGSNACHFLVENRSATPTGPVDYAYSLINMDTQQAVTRFTQSADIGGGMVKSWTQQINAKDLVYGSYACVLEAGIYGQWQTISSVGFEILPPKVDSVISVGTKSRLLVLLDKPRECSSLDDINVQLDFGASLSDATRIEVQLLKSNGVLLDTQLASQFNVDLNSAIAPFDADLAVNVDVSGLIRAHIDAMPSASLGDAYKVKVIVTKNFIFTSFKEWTIDTSCDRPFTIGELYEDATLLAYHPWDSGSSVAGSDPYGPLDGPGVEDQETYLKSLLDEAGWEYTIVHTADEFRQAHRTGSYGTYMVMSERPMLHLLVQKEAREAVFNGAGLIMAGAYDKRNLWLENALGISVVGRHPWADAVNMLQSNISSEWSAPLPVRDWASGAVLAGATQVGSYTLTGDDQLTEWCWLDQGSFVLNDLSQFNRRAATTYDYGKGKSVYFGFDLLMQASAPNAAPHLGGLIRNALSYVNPTSPVPEQSGVVPLNIQLNNQRGATTGRATLVLPAGAELVVPGVFQQMGDQWVWDFSIDDKAQLASRIYVRLPVDGSEATFGLSVATDIDNQYLEQTPAAISVAFEPLPSTEDTLAALDQLAWTYWYRLNYRDAYYKFQLAMSAMDQGNWEAAQTWLVIASDLLLPGDEADVKNVRQKVDEHIRQVGITLNSQ